jgi:hypothetical protein
MLLKIARSSMNDILSHYVPLQHPWCHDDDQLSSSIHSHYFPAILTRSISAE